jgi:2-methylcitrate dehydratase PrpD
MDTFTERMLHRPGPQSLLAKTRLTMDPNIPTDFDQMWIIVTVVTEYGAEYSVRCDRPRGIWGNPLSREERLAKVRQCAARVLSEDGIEEMIDSVEDLDDAIGQDVLELAGLLSRAPSSST